MNILPEEFWDMTLKEIDLVMKGQQALHRRQMEMLAWHAANLMNMWRSKGPAFTMEKLLPPERRKRKETQPVDKAEAIARFRARQEKELEDAFWLSPEGRDLAARIDEE